MFKLNVIKDLIGQKIAIQTFQGEEEFNFSLVQGKRFRLLRCDLIDSEIKRKQFEQFISEHNLNPISISQLASPVREWKNILSQHFQVVHLQHEYQWHRLCHLYYPTEHLLFLEQESESAKLPIKLINEAAG